MEIQVKDIAKSYGGLKAVDGITFDINRGEVYGIIGPNGAGKTTLMEIMLGLRRQDGGTVTIQGLDSVRDHKKLVYRVGAQLQESELPANIKVREAVKLQASLFGVRTDIGSRLREFNLEEKSGAYCSRLSGGQKQRLFILLAVIHNPDIVFFDELSTGLDPVSRQEIWNYVGELKKQGKTIIVSTHYMQEAEEICDRVMLVNEGKIVDIGTACELKEKLPFHRVLEFECIGEEEKILQDLQRACGFCGAEKLPPKRYRVFITDQFSIDRFLETQREAVTGVQSRQSSFEDYFYYKVKMKG